MRTGALALFFITALAAGTVHAQWGIWDSEFDENKKPWKEIEAKLPAYPKDGGQMAFDVGSASPHRFLLDVPSLSIGEDGIVRYTLVIKTAGGATNVTFEGIRCETREQKVYALGHAGGAWTRARNPQWRRIVYQEVNRHHGTLFSDYLCYGGGSTSKRIPVASVEEIVRRLKYGPPMDSFK